MMPVVFLSLGTNIENKEENIANAIVLLSENCKIKKQSHLYLTEPVGNIKQEWFLNCAIEVETTLEPTRLLSKLKSIEQKLGRVKTVKHGPRTIDIDILFYEDRIVNTKSLVIPHPLLHDRLFVLQPMMDLQPNLAHPVLKLTIQELYMRQSWKEKVLLYK